MWTQLAEFCFIAACLFFGDCDALRTEHIVVSTTIRSRFAETIVSSIFWNSKSLSQEVEFQVLIPHEAFITSFALKIDDNWHEGYVEERGEALKKYSIAKDREITSGLLETRENTVNTFKTRVNVGPNKEIEFELIYQQLLRRINGKYRHSVLLHGSQLTKELEVEVHICETKPLLEITALPIFTGDGTRIFPVTEVIKDFENTASLYFLSPNNKAFVRSLLSTGGLFTVEYEVEPYDANGEFVVENSNFIHFFAPEVDMEPRKIVFVLDISGSMNSQRKLRHLKTAMYNILIKLTDKDRFGIITFESRINLWRVRSQAMNWATKNNLFSANRFIQNIIAQGYTEFHEPLQRAIKLLEQDTKLESPDPISNYIVLITDGRASSNPKTQSGNNNILSEISKMNGGRFGIHAIGLGKDVDATVLSKLTAHNGGSWRQLYPDINTAIQMQNYLAEIGVDRLNISYSEMDAVSSTALLPPVSRGGEYVITGKLTEKAKQSTKAYDVIVTDADGVKEVKSMRFYTRSIDVSCATLDPQKAANFTEKAHALAKVLNLMRLIDQSTDAKIESELKREAVNLAKSYRLVTPFTTMVVMKPGDKAEVELFYQRQKKDIPTTVPPTVEEPKWIPPVYTFFGDPHVIVRLSSTMAICFEISGKDGEMYNFLHDPDQGIIINGVLTAGANSTEKRTPLIQEIAIILKIQKLLLMVNPYEIIVYKYENKLSRTLLWRLRVQNTEEYWKDFYGVNIVIKNALRSITMMRVDIKDGISLQIKLCRKIQSLRQSHLDLQVFHADKFRFPAGGIFGHFQNIIVNKLNKVTVFTTARDKYIMHIENKWLTVTKRKHTAFNVISYCWHVRNLKPLFGTDLESSKLSYLLEEPNIPSKNVIK